MFVFSCLDIAVVRSEEDRRWLVAVIDTVDGSMCRLMIDKSADL